MIPESEPSLQPEHDGQCGRDEQQIVELPVEKRAADAGKEEPTIDGVQQARARAERIAEIPMRGHSNARMTQPVEIARSSLPKKIIARAV